MHQHTFFLKKTIMMLDEVPITYNYKELSTIINKYLNYNINKSAILL